MTKDEFLDLAKKYKYFEVDYDTLVNALDKYTLTVLQQDIVSPSICKYCGGEGWIYELNGNIRKCKHR